MKRMLCIMGICGIALFGVKPDRFTAIVREIRTRMVHPNSVHAAIGGPITIDAPVTFTKDVGITSASYKFIDSANPAYFIAPGNSDISLVVRGKVGIGTTTPATTLDVNGSAYIGTTTNRLYIKDDNDAIELIGFNGTSYNNISLRASGGPTLHLNTNGKVGIGTTTPSQVLHVASATSGQARIRGSSSSTTADAYSGLEFYGGAAGTTWGGGLLRDQSTNDLSIWTANSGSVPKITILNTGLVGIGTTAPGANLTVAGGKLQVTGNTAPTSGAGVELGHDGTTGSLVSYDRTGSEYKAMRFNALNLNFENSGVEYMRITGGKVGIGTTNPTSTLTLKNTPSASTPVILYVNNSNAEMFRISAPVSSTVFIGSNAGGISNTGANNFAVGTDALCTNTSGHSNNAFGNMALSGNLTGGHNNAFGDSALSGTTVSNNSAFGDTALMFDSTGHDNSAFGASALLMNETGIYNNAFGNSALANSNGAANNAFGYQALTANTSGTHNIAFGYMALFANEIGTRNIAIGTQALYVNNGVAAEGSYNVSVGYQSMLANTTGYGNVGMGYSALSDLTTGYYNVAVGYGAGPVAGTPALHHTVALGYNATPLADHEMRFSSSQTLYYMYGTWVNASDRRLKKNITDYAVGLDFIKNLKPVSYELIKDEGVIGKRYEGFIAQDVEETMNTLHVQFGGLYKPPSTAPSDSPMGISYERLVVPLVNAVKEQQTQIESLAKQLTHISLSTTDGLNIEKIAGIDQYAVRNTKDNSVMNQIGAFAEVVVGKIRAGILETKQLIVDGVDVAKKLTELSDKVIELSNKVESQQKQIEELKTEIKMLDAGR